MSMHPCAMIGRAACPRGRGAWELAGSRIPPHRLMVMVMTLMVMMMMMVMMMADDAGDDA